MWMSSGNKSCSWVIYYTCPVLAGMISKYHISVDCQELYFSKWVHFPKACSPEGTYCHKEKYNSLGATKMRYFIRLSWLVKMSSFKFIYTWWCSMTTRFGNKTRILRTKWTKRKHDSIAHLLLWHSIVNYCVLWIRSVHDFISFWVSFLIEGIDVIVVATFIRC